MPGIRNMDAFGIEAVVSIPPTTKMGFAVYLQEAGKPSQDQHKQPAQTQAEITDNSAVSQAVFAKLVSSAGGP